MQKIYMTGASFLRNVVQMSIAIPVLIALTTTLFGAPTAAGAQKAEGEGSQNKTDAGTLKFLTLEYLPFAALENGKPVGFGVEILHEIMRRLGRADTIEFDQWSVAYERALTQPATVLMPPSRTPDREDLFKWVGPLIPEKVMLFARKDSSLVINSLEDAKGARGIATIKGAASEKFLEKKGFTNLVGQRSALQGPDALKFKRVELWLNSNVTMKQLALSANVDPDLFEPAFVVMEVPSYLAFSRDIPDNVVNQWQDALDNMKEDGTWERIVSKWVPSDLLKIGEDNLKLTEKERQWIDSHPTVKVVHSFHQPPFNMDVENSRTGYLYELMFETLSMAGLSAEFAEDFSTYSSMIDALQDGDVDILTNVNSTRVLPDNIYTTVPVIRTPNVVVGRISAPQVRETPDLFGTKVAVVRGYAQDQHLDNFPKIKKIHVSNNEEGFEAVRTGRAEYFLNNLANSNYVLNKTFATDLSIAGTLSYTDFPPLTLSFGIHDENSQLPGIMEKALAAVPIHTLSRLREKWLDQEPLAATPEKIDLTPEERAFLKANPVIRVHNEQNWAPFNFYEKDQAAGFSIDYMNLLAEKIGLQVEYVSGPTWNEFISMIKDRRLDVMLNIVKTEEREKFLKFSSQPYIETPRAIVVRKDNASVSKLSDLNNKTVAVEKGFFYERYLKENHPQINVMTVKDTAETLRVVANGDADATLGVIAVEQFLIRRHFFSNLKLVVDPGERALRSFDQFIGVRSDWPQLASMIDKAMAAVTDKELVLLSRKWIAQEEDAKRIDLTPEESAYLKDHPILKIAYDIDWPPVEYADREHGMKGMSADYLERIGRLLGVKFEPSQPRPWRKMMAAVGSGELDLFSAISPTPQRLEWLDFTEPYLSFPIVIITGKEVPYVGSLWELEDNPVAVADGYASHDFLAENYPDLNLLITQDVKEGLMSVSTGKAFAFVGSLAAVSHIMSREGLTDLKVSGETPYSYDLAMGVDRNNKILLSILGKALTQIPQQERNAINSRWTSVTYEHKLDYSLIWRILVVALIIIVIVLYWNNRLKQEVAERKRAELAAETANKAKSEFLANMSHELRTPLNAILGFAQIMERNPDISSEKESLRIIQQSGTHLLTLINQVLDFSKIEAGHIALEEHGFDLFHLLDELESMLSIKADEKFLTLEVSCAQEVPRYICADEIKLRQVLINLLGNAIKFTDEGTVKLRVSLMDSNEAGSTEGDHVILFEVKDTGPGIAREEMDKLFEAFGQTATGREAREGTGLGLLISNKFVQLMGGQMKVSSEPGKGTAFSFSIKTKEAFAVHMPKEFLNRRVVALEPGQSQYRILVVDDKQDNRQLLTRLLSPLGFEIREAENGQEAFEIWRNWNPHLIWMDMRMPVMNGYEATRCIRAQDSSIQAPAIIAVTASILEENRAEVLSIGCDDILIKPFKESKIMEMLEKHLGVRFQYAEDKPLGESAPVLNPDLRVNIKDLEALPEDIFEKLKKSVATLEMDTTLSIIEEIREYNASLAKALRKLVDGYRFDKLMKFLDGKNDG